MERAISSNSAVFETPLVDHPPHTKTKRIASRNRIPKTRTHYLAGPTSCGTREHHRSGIRKVAMRVGYARVSTGEQSLDLQLDALRQAGCERVFTDEVSGAKAERPGLGEARSYLRAGDTLVVWRLDRLGRSLKDLVQQMEEFADREIGFQSLHEAIDTTSSVGKFQFHIFSALAEFERELIRERTLAGLRAARARGRNGGRPRRMTGEKLKIAARLMRDPAVSVPEVCRTVGVSRSTLYRYISPDGSIRAG